MRINISSEWLGIVLERMNVNRKPIPQSSRGRMKCYFNVYRATEFVSGPTDESFESNCGEMVFLWCPRNIDLRSTNRRKYNGANFTVFECVKLSRTLQKVGVSVKKIIFCCTSFCLVICHLVLCFDMFFLLVGSPSKKTIWRIISQLLFLWIR